MQLVPSNKYVLILRIRVCIVSAVIAFACGIISIFFVTAAVLTVTTVAAVVVVIMYVYIPRFAASCSITLSDSAISVRRGVILRRNYVLPNPRLVYAERIQTPLGILFSTCAVNIRLARSSVLFEGLSIADADLILTYTAKGGGL